MTNIRENIEEIFTKITLAESGEYRPVQRKKDKAATIEDIFISIAMAEGGEDEYAMKLFNSKKSRNTSRKRRHKRQGIHHSSI